MIPLETQGHALWRKVLQGAAQCCAAGAQQRHLMRLHIPKGTGDSLFGRELPDTTRLEQDRKGFASVDGHFQRVFLYGLSSGLRQAQFVF